MNCQLLLALSSGSRAAPCNFQWNPFGPKCSLISNLTLFFFNYYHKYGPTYQVHPHAPSRDAWSDYDLRPVRFRISWAHKDPIKGQQSLVCAHREWSASIQWADTDDQGAYLNAAYLENIRVTLRYEAPGVQRALRPSLQGAYQESTHEECTLRNESQGG